MLKALPFDKNRMLSINYLSMPKEYRDEFNNEILKLNIEREVTFSLILIGLNVALLYVDLNRFRVLYPSNSGYRNLFHAHILILIFLLVYLFIINMRNKKFSCQSCIFDKIFCICFALFILTWCSYLSINAQLIHHQISAYIIGIFCTASALVFTYYEGILIYIYTYLFFIIGLFFVPHNPRDLSGIIVNSSILTVLAISISYINYASYVKNFINKKTILQKNQEIHNLYKISEETLVKRTQELVHANELLISEINAKHHMEIEIMKARLEIEEKQKLLNESKEYENLRTAFFANISHELRTPLNVIFSANQMMNFILKNSNHPLSSKDINKYMHIINQNCYRLIRLISNLIDITKIDAGYFEINPKNCEIVKIVEDITLSVVKYAEDKGITIIFDTETEEKIISCDPDKIERIMLNLLSNAIKFTSHGGNIYVNMYTEDNNVVISVKDTGIGIPQNMQSKVFDRFVQVDKSTTRKKEGSGIGLSLVKSLVEMHNGSISLISEYGKGSEFIIKLPDVISESCEDNSIPESSKNDQNIEKINIEFSDIYS